MDDAQQQPSAEVSAEDATTLPTSRSLLLGPLDLGLLLAIRPLLGVQARTTLREVCREVRDALDAARPRLCLHLAMLQQMLMTERCERVRKRTPGAQPYATLQALSRFPPAQHLEALDGLPPGLVQLMTQCAAESGQLDAVRQLFERLSWPEAYAHKDPALPAADEAEDPAAAAQQRQLRQQQLSAGVAAAAQAAFWCEAAHLGAVPLQDAVRSMAQLPAGWASAVTKALGMVAPPGTGGAGLQDADAAEADVAGHSKPFALPQALAPPLALAIWLAHQGDAPARLLARQLATEVLPQGGCGACALATLALAHLVRNEGQAAAACVLLLPPSHAPDLACVVGANLVAAGDVALALKLARHARCDNDGLLGSELLVWQHAPDGDDMDNDGLLNCMAAFKALQGAQQQQLHEEAAEPQQHSAGGSNSVRLSAVADALDGVWCGEGMIRHQLTAALGLHPYVALVPGAPSQRAVEALLAQLPPPGAEGAHDGGGGPAAVQRALLQGALAAALLRSGHVAAALDAAAGLQGEALDAALCAWLGAFGARSEVLGGAQDLEEEEAREGVAPWVLQGGRMYRPWPATMELLQPLLAVSPAAQLRAAVLHAAAGQGNTAVELLESLSAAAVAAAAAPAAPPPPVQRAPLVRAAYRTLRVLVASGQMEAAMRLADLLSCIDDLQEPHLVAWDLVLGAMAGDGGRGLGAHGALAAGRRMAALVLRACDRIVLMHLETLVECLLCCLAAALSHGYDGEAAAAEAEREALVTVLRALLSCRDRVSAPVSVLLPHYYAQAAAAAAGAAAGASLPDGTRSELQARLLPLVRPLVLAEPVAERWYGFVCWMAAPSPEADADLPAGVQGPVNGLGAPSAVSEAISALPAGSREAVAIGSYLIMETLLRYVEAGDCQGGARQEPAAAAAADAPGAGVDEATASELEALLQQHGALLYGRVEPGSGGWRPGAVAGVQQPASELFGCLLARTRTGAAAAVHKRLYRALLAAAPSEEARWAALQPVDLT